MKNKSCGLCDTCYKHYHANECWFNGDDEITAEPTLNDDPDFSEYGDIDSLFRS